MKNVFFAVCLLGALSLTTACGDKADPKAPTTTPSSADPPATATTPPVASAEPEPAKKRKPFEIYSTCSDVVTIAFGENAKDPKAGKKTIAPSSSIEGARDNDGNQTVWLLDNNGEPLVKVNVTRGMKRVEIGKSCRTLDAR